MDPLEAMLVWRFLRISGIALLLFALVHLAIMHYVNAPSATNAAFVDGRWVAIGWTAFDAILLVLGLTHGMAGLQAILRDALIASSNARALRTANVAVASATIVFVAVGIATLIEPAQWRSNPAAAPLSGSFWIAGLLHLWLNIVATCTYGALFVIAVTLIVRISRGQPLEWWGLEGQWAWALHRVTGLGILAFLLLHVVDIALLPLAPDVYDATVANYARPYLIPMEVLLVGAVIYHALNGVRLIALEAWDRRALRWRSVTIAGVIVLTAILVAPSIVVLVHVAR
ncbi:MAG: hypothetical protein ACREM6_14025 [Vulcanimicrobiaceae bacterium]